MKFLIFSLCFFTLVSCKVELFRTLDEREANLIIKTLESQGIEASKFVTDKRKGKFGIEVPEHDASKAISILSSKDLPKVKHRGFNSLLENNSLIPSVEDKTVKYFIALGGELSKTLESLPGIQFARVHFAIDAGHNDFSNRKTSVKKASVVLKVENKEFQLKGSDIQSMIAGSLPELQPENVAVIIQITDTDRVSLPEMSSFGPFRVSPSSHKWLVLIFFVFLTIIIALTVSLVFVIRLRKRNEQLIDDLTEDLQ
ncbi:MAG: hypothetical protein JXR95_08340 [Deltaproteobacteria bacterium]|nr:hypothetical protein [Deltaproteobacteria bacterium]